MLGPLLVLHALHNKPRKTRLSSLSSIFFIQRVIPLWCMVVVGKFSSGWTCDSDSVSVDKKHTDSSEGPRRARERRHRGTETGRASAPAVLISLQRPIFAHPSSSASIASRQPRDPPVRHGVGSNTTAPYQREAAFQQQRGKPDIEMHIFRWSVQMALAWMWCVTVVTSRYGVCGLQVNTSCVHGSGSAIYFDGPANAKFIEVASACGAAAGGGMGSTFSQLTPLQQAQALDALPPSSLLGSRPSRTMMAWIRVPSHAALKTDQFIVGQWRRHSHAHGIV